MGDLQRRWQHADWASFSIHALPAVSPSSILIQAVTCANTLAGSIIVINDYNLNGSPLASFLVIRDWNPGDEVGVYNNHAIGAWYDTNPHSEHQDYLGRHTRLPGNRLDCG
jgi:hypothetical protein